MSTVKDDVSQIISQYMCAVRSEHAATKDEVCDLNSDLASIMQFPSISFDKKNIFNKAQTAYYHIYNMLDIWIREYVKQANYKFQYTYEVVAPGALYFKNPPLYIKNAQNEVYGIAPSDETIEYEFLMFRKIAGSKATKIKDGFTLSSDPLNPAIWSNCDLIDAFDYKNEAKVVIDPYTLSSSFNPEAAAIFKANEVGLTAIIKKIFKADTINCNILKNTDSYSQTMICNTVANVYQKDYFIDYMTCLEVFNLVTLPDFCD